MIPIDRDEIGRCSPFFAEMLGDRYSWIALKDQYWAEVIDRQAWLEEHRGGVRVNVLDILHGMLRPRDDRGCLLLLL